MDVKNEGFPRKASAFHEQPTEDSEEGGVPSLLCSSEVAGFVLGNILGGT